MKRFLIVVLATASLVATAQASAAVRYASPTGGYMDSCNARFPCHLTKAIEDAANDGDEVVVLSGDYTIYQTIHLKKKLNIHGEARQPRPRLLAPPVLARNRAELRGPRRR